MINKPAFRKMILPIAIAASLTACGGGGGGGGGGSSAPSGSVTGSSSKGIIIGGIVNAYGLTETGEVDRDTPLAEPATTADDGSYALSLNDDYVAGSAIYIEITAEDGTVMKCDLQQCSEGVVFGDTYPLASDFKMSAVAPSASGDSISVNVTPLTDIAARLTKQKVVSGARASDAAAASNSQIADRFKLTGGLIGQPIVDITSADAVNGATKAALEYNLKAAGAVAAALAANSGATVEEALESFATQYADTGIADREAEAADSVSLEELLEQSLAILGEVQGLEGIDNSEESALAQTNTSIQNSEATASESENTEPTQGDIDPDAGSAGVVAAKLFVKQIRDLATATTIGTKQQAFADEVELASDAISGDADAVAEATGLALNAIAVAAGQYEDADEGQEPSSATTDGITVSISESNGAVTYNIDQDVTIADTTVVALDFTAVNANDISFEETEDEDGDSTFDGNATIDMSLTGSAASSGVSLAISEGSLSGSITIDENATVNQDDEDGFDEDFDGNINIANINADLEGVLTQLGGDNPVTFTGNFGFELDALSATEDGNYADNNSGVFEESYTEVLSLDNAVLSLSGAFSNESGDSLSASLTAMLGNVSETCVITDEGNYNTNQFSYSEECTDETEQDFATANLSINFALDVPGVDEDVSVDFDVSRTGLETGEGTLQLSYNGMQLNLAYEGGDSVTLSNQNNVVLTLTEAEDESISGAITQNDVEYATVSDESGTIIVRYTDGSFESAM